MRTFAMIVSMLLGVSGVSWAGQPDRGMGGVGITVFQDSDYRGRNATFREDVPELDEYDLDDRISSLRVAPGEMWEVCEREEYRGRCQVFSGDEPNLRERGWNDSISSMRRLRGGGWGGRWGGGRPPFDRPGQPSWGRGLELFEDRDFRGDSRVLNGPIEDLRQLGFNDRARSLRLPRGESWEVCVDNYFRNCRVVNGDSPDLGGLGLSRRVSSARPLRQGGLPGTWPTPGGTQLTLYDNRGFRGRSIVIAQSMESVDDRFSPESARVSGRWELCDGTRFTGRCVVIGADEADIRSLGLRGRIRSARPVGRF